MRQPLKPYELRSSRQPFETIFICGTAIVAEINARCAPVGFRVWRFAKSLPLARLFDVIDEMHGGFESGATSFTPDFLREMDSYSLSWMRTANCRL